MKHPKTWQLLLALLFLAALPTLSNWRTGVFESGDFGFHTQALTQFYDSLAAGILFPRWVADFCGKFGSPEFRFFYYLPYYIASFFHFIGFSIINSMKLFLSLTYIMAVVTMFCWLRSEFDERSAFIGSIFYIFTPYFLTTLHFTHAIGELLALMLAPLLLLSIRKYLLKQNLRSFFWITFFYTLIILSHHIAPVLLAPLLLAYTFIRKQHIRQGIDVLLALGLAQLLTAFHWLPILLDSKLIQQSTTQTLLFHPYSTLFFSHWKFGLLFQGSHGEIQPTLGYMHLIFILLSMRFFKRFSNAERQLSIVCISILIMCLFLLYPLTYPLWLRLPLMHNFQFASRLLWLTTILTAPLAAMVTAYAFKYIERSKWKSKESIFAAVLCGSVILPTVLNWGNRGMIPDINDQITRLQAPERCDKVTLPLALHFDAIPKVARSENIEVVTGQADITQTFRNAERHTYIINATTPSIVKENTMYFPGWYVTINGKVATVQHPDRVGQMFVNVPAGRNIMDFVYGFTFAEWLGQGISIITLIFTSFVIIFLNSHKKVLVHQ